VKVYEYAKCSTCVKALKFLDKKNVEYSKKAIVDTPPSLSELKTMLKHLKTQGKSIRNLFNTSGQLYREMNMAEKLKTETSEEALLKLLAGHGKLIKRPFLLTENTGVVGFNEDEWKKLF
ncbi:MAG: Spx/MgsR family RNA polymerase-binding regulatory protein, partial [Pseudobdellovibrio sp.]